MRLKAHQLALAALLMSCNDAPPPDSQSNDTGVAEMGEVSGDLLTGRDSDVSSDQADAPVADLGIDAPAPDVTPDTTPDPVVDAPTAEPDVSMGPAERCFHDQFASPPTIGPDYDQFDPVIGSHCMGTNHQEITDIERVVFLGDSVTSGTPPHWSEQFYRALLADRLASYFDIEPPSLLWKSVDLLGDGESLEQESGAFANCADWGARTDDLTRQIGRCFSEPGHFSERTLVVMTMGGNDIAKITQAGIDGVPVAEIWDDAEAYVGHLRDAMAWFREPERFPNGVFVTYSNNFEFTDGTGDTAACPAAAVAGFSQEWDDPDALADIVIWATEQYMDIAVEQGFDLAFTLESFCGHGFNSDDPAAPCYRGPGNANWFDLTCIHPNPTGYVQLANIFLNVISE